MALFYLFRMFIFSRLYAYRVFEGICGILQTGHKYILSFDSWSR